ncbi:hypothetical protein P0F38_002659 [Vibrio metschnikovii]|jgi:hypothetical protein|nr:hypothetical protein [Vibrio metschnikovii]
MGKQMIKKQLVVLVGLAILAGCSSTKDIPPTNAELHQRYGIPQQPTDQWIQENLPIYEAKADKLLASDDDVDAYYFLLNIAENRGSADIEAHKKQDRVDRGLNVSYEDLGLGGAAFRKPDYIHVLGPSSLGANNESALIKQQKDKNGSNMEDAISAYKKLSSGVKGKGYSLYELSRWERFCDSGNGMDERDWKFIEKEKGETGSIPSDLVGQCNPPQHTYQDYLTAWTQFCSSQKMTNEQRNIVRSSTRPFTVVNPCKAIK